MTRFLICLQLPHQELELRPIDMHSYSLGRSKRRAATRTGPTPGSEAPSLAGLFMQGYGSVSHKDLPAALSVISALTVPDRQSLYHLFQKRNKQL